MDTNQVIKQYIEQHPVMLFMKGTPQAPQCGFSMRVVQALRACNAQFGYVNVLENPDIRSGLPAYSDWPTFPQLFIDEELIGGCDIVLELFEQGELQTMLEQHGKVEEQPQE